MNKMIQTTSGDHIHPQDFVRRRRWAGSRTSPALLAASYASEDASSEAN